MAADPEVLIINHNQINFAALAVERLAEAQACINQVLLGEGEHAEIKAYLDRISTHLRIVQQRSEIAASEYWARLIAGTE